MKKQNCNKIFLFSYIIFLIVSFLQFFIWNSNRIEIYMDLLKILDGFNLCIMFLICYFIFNIFRYKKFLYLYIMIQLYGVLISTYYYNEYLKIISEINNIKILQKFIMYPYIISIIINIITYIIQYRYSNFIIEKINHISHLNIKKQILKYLFNIFLTICFLLMIYLICNNYNYTFIIIGVLTAISGTLIQKKSTRD